LRIHFLEAFRLTLIGRKRQYEGKHASSLVDIYSVGLNGAIQHYKYPLGYLHALL